MAKKKQQKAKDLEELVAKLAKAKGVVFTDYRGTTVKDLDKFRRSLRQENVFSKVYKMTLVNKALEQTGMKAKVDHKTPVIMAISSEDEVAPARIIKNLTKDVKTISILEGIIEGKMFSKVEVETLGSLPNKDQLRAQLLSVFNGPAAAFVRLLDAYAKKKGEGAPVAA
ncbi:MAG: 50S ribosomal protein L10 [Patescibacteria group bacterium]|nr:50S ribosomal protein L10 [Patescibacteria group bacterium]